MASYINNIHLHRINQNYFIYIYVCIIFYHNCSFIFNIPVWLRPATHYVRSVFLFWSTVSCIRFPGSGAQAQCSLRSTDITSGVRSVTWVFLGWVSLVAELRRVLLVERRCGVRCAPLTSFLMDVSSRRLALPGKTSLDARI